MRRQCGVVLDVARGLPLVTATILADGHTPESDSTLALRYAPLLYVHREEIVRPCRPRREG